MDSVGVVLGCGAAQREEAAVGEQLPAPDREAAQRGALETLAGIRGSTPDLARWRPTTVLRLDDLLAVLDDSHAFIWEEDTWSHVELPGPALFGVDSMSRPQNAVKADGHRAVFAGPSAPCAQTIGLFQLTRAGVESLGALPDWVHKNDQRQRYWEIYDKRRRPPADMVELDIGIVGTGARQRMWR